MEIAWLIPASPLVGFILLVLVGRRLGEPVAGWLATLASAVAFAATVVTFLSLQGQSEHAQRFELVEGFTWINAGDFVVDVGLLLDPLSITMSLFITGIGTLIHLYSIGYMHGDKNFSKFFIYLNLFIASMLMLVLGDNLLLTFLGWEGVGACSYLLISFWFDDEANASAGKKAFVTNRIGDFGFMLATFFVFVELGSINYDDILSRSSEIDGTVGPFNSATVIVLLFMLAAAGKSAQLPLYVWLPDAMAGPTPVSALIHAATMVTSGVFLLTRLNPILAEADTWALGTVAWIGALTGLFAATAALAQTDIKKVLAYSTVSQLGYLFLAVGIGAYVPAIFHMITHAFFKALLFLGSGSVIHGLHDEQDMRRMGGVKKYMPITAFTFIIGWLAIAGVPPFSGFWSKDEILLYAWNADAVGGKALWAIGLVTALLTAFYMTRQVILTFYGRTRFFDVTSDELDHAWETQLAEPGESVALIDADRTSIIETMTSSQEDIDQYEDLQASGDAPGNVDELLKTARSINEKAVLALENVDVAHKKATAALTDLGKKRSASAHVPRTVTAQTPAPFIDDIEEHLPQSYRDRQEYHPHESPWTMTAPLVILAVLAAVGGGLNLPFTKDLHFLDHWLEPSLFGNSLHPSSSANEKIALALVAVAVGVVAIFAAFQIYYKGRANPDAIEKETLLNAWNLDNGYAAFMGGPGRALFNALAWFDRTIVDGAVNGVSKVVSVVGSGLSVTQPGYVRSYALGIGAGTVIVAAWFIGRLFI